jgi:sulfatase modifying factor 1
MKHTKIFSTLLLLALAFTSYSQDTKKFIAEIEQAYKPIEGTNYLANECECTNENYAEFLKDGNGKNLVYTYDSTGWNMKAYFPTYVSFNEPMMAVYSWHNKYKTYPVVNVNHESAVAYCAWLTEKYNSSDGRKYKKVEFKLPTEAEWMKAAYGKMLESPEAKVFPWRGLSLRDKNGCYFANSMMVGEYNIKRNSDGKLVLAEENTFGSDYGSDGNIYTAKCKGEFLPNDFGLYHMAGNVSEFTRDSKITKGGSYVSPGYYLRIKTNDPEFPNMDKGGAFIGFRPFMYVLEK